MYTSGENESLSSLSMPCKVSPFYQQLIHTSGYYEKLRRTVEPSPQELQAPGKLDTSGESDSTVVPGLDVLPGVKFSALGGRPPHELNLDLLLEEFVNAAVSRIVGRGVVAFQTQ